MDWSITLMMTQSGWEKRLLEAQHRNFGEGFLFFFSGLHLFGCFLFNCWILGFFCGSIIAISNFYSITFQQHRS